MWQRNQKDGQENSKQLDTQLNVEQSLIIRTKGYSLFAFRFTNKLDTLDPLITSLLKKVELGKQRDVRNISENQKSKGLKHVETYFLIQNWFVSCVSEIEV